MSALHDLARAAGLQTAWQDAQGTGHTVSDASLEAILAALGYSTDGEDAIAESIARLNRGDAADCAFVTAETDKPILLSRTCATPGAAELILENGRRSVVSLEAAANGVRLPAIATPGYHRLIVGTGEITLAVAPPRCFTVADAAGERRLWGPAVQIPALRGDRAAAFGDFGTLATSALAFAARGADALAISPVHALFPADASRFSPYAPSSRLFLNGLFGDPALVGATGAPASAGGLIDWEHAIPERLRAMRVAYNQRSDMVRAEVAAFAQHGGEPLAQHACFDALHAHFFTRNAARGWQDWPAAYHDPASEAVTRFAGEHAEDVGFYLFLQWLARRSLADAQRAATGAGMALGLIADLAVGMDSGGSHAWSRPDEMLTGLSIGAPPDPLGPDGQDWGITAFAPEALRRTGFAPFIDTLRAAIGDAGGIRIDHALGLRRLWVVPAGGTARDGAYLTMPMADMMRLLALESHRARAVVIGEDLGTVPEGFRPQMEEIAMLGMRVLWFERDSDGAFEPPAAYAATAAAMTGTHDLPTVAGWWQGRDIDWTWQLGRTSSAANEADEQAARGEDRTRLWSALKDAGAASGAEPDAGDPAPVVDAALAFVGETPAPLAILPMEDVIGLTEQPNLPGTIHEHPNWRRRMPDTTDALLDRPDVAPRLAALLMARSRR